MSNLAKTKNLKIIAGTDRGDRDSAIASPEFDPVTEFPVPPQSLNIDGVELWQKLGPQLVNAGVLQVVDLYALEQLAYTWQVWKQKSKAGMEITASETNALKAFWQEFGCTPAARRRIATPIDPDKDKNKFAKHRKKSA